MKGVAQDSKHFHMVMEFVRGGELFSYLQSNGPFSFSTTCFYAAQVACIFEYLHSRDIIYRDLKPENLLIDEVGYLRLTDFGFAKVCPARTYTFCGTPDYLSPEILLNKGHGKAVDWWTFGILLYEMLTGFTPFADEDPMVSYKKILDAKVAFPKDFDRYFFAMINRNAKSLVKHLLTPDLTRRYGNLKNGVQDIKGHRFFREVSWDDLLAKRLKAPYIPLLK